MRIQKLMKLGFFVAVMFVMMGHMYPSQMAANARIGVSFPHMEAYPGIGSNGGFECYVTPSITLEGVLGYHRIGGKLLGAATINIWQLSLNSRIYFSVIGPLKPYVNGGIGIYFQRPVQLPIQRPGSEDFGFNLGAGLDYYLNPSWALELAYNFHYIKPGYWRIELSSLQAGLKWKF
ncbi:MAG: outer membrane beta-barrel protein [Candidatus Omnitrophota bacterium]